MDNLPGPEPGSQDEMEPRARHAKRPHCWHHRRA